MRKILLIKIGLFLSYLTTYGQTGAITGSIIDAKSGETLPGVSVLIQGTDIGGVTNLEGGFTINNVPTGTVVVSFNFLGYIKKDQTVTVKEGGTVNLSTVSLKEDAIGLEEVEILASFVDEGRQPPTPISTITAAEIEEKMGAQEFPEILKSTPGVFVNTGGGSFGDASVRIRGFASENSAVLINGIPVNDMETGRVFWSNWGGMSDVTYNKQVQRGLGATKLAVSSVGGTLNIITKPTEFRKGIRLSYASANRSWQNMFMLSASTGLMKGGWAFTVLGSTRFGDGFREGTSTEAYSYFLAASKTLNDRHQLVLTAFGAPQITNRGVDATELSYETVGRKTYNPAWGLKGGEELNAFQNRYHKPKFFLNHYFDINEKATLSSSIYYYFGRGGGTSIGRGPGTGNPIPFNLGPGAPDSLQQINWDRLVDENQNNFRTLRDTEGNVVAQGNLSRYIIQEARNDHNWMGALTTLNIDFDEKTSGTFGIDYRWYRGFHYREVVDLLGGDFYVDLNRNSPLTTFSGSDPNAGLYGAQRNRLNPYGVAREGDRIDYDYNGTVTWGGLFAQVEREIGNVDVFLTGNFVRSTFQRNGRFLPDDFVENSLGESELYVFNNFTVKAGANYKITGRHNVFFNSGYFTRAPFFRDAFVDNRYSNEVRGDLVSEEVYSFELGYGYRSPRFAANVNLYSTNWNNQAFTTGFLTPVNTVITTNEGNQIQTNGDFLQFRLSNVDAIHQGVEVDFTSKLTNTLSLKGMVSVGDWRWANNPNAIVFTDPGFIEISDQQTIYTQDLRVGGVPQTTVALGPKYRSPKFWYAGLSANYYDNMYADYNPQDRLIPGEFFTQVQRLPEAFTLDVYAGKSWKFGKDLRLKIKGSINNLLDNQFIIDSRQRTDLDPNASPFVQFYFGRTYYVSAAVSL